MEPGAQRPGRAEDWTALVVDGQRFSRLPVRTPWLEERDDLASVLLAYLPPLRRTDTVVVSEKVAVLLNGGGVDIATLPVGSLARMLARWVQPRPGSRGLSVPHKMQYVVEHVGRARLLAAVAAAGLTRPVGIRGVFYRVAGTLARDLDGGRPPYEHLLFPPMPAPDAADLCADLQEVVGAGVAVVDINDFGGSIRSSSERALAPSRLLRVLADNPLGQRATGTPFAVVRRGAPTAQRARRPLTALRTNTRSGARSAHNPAT